MRVGVVGLGLIGGSMARAVKQRTEHQVLGWDAKEPVLYSAKLVGAVDEFMEEGDPSECDIVIVALYPQATIDYIKKNGPRFKKDAVVVDCCGVKGIVCGEVKETAEMYGFNFVGAHPMAGIEKSGFNYSNASIFDNATMILTPYQGADLTMMNELSFFFKRLGFGRMQVTTPDEHDKMIAYTSQLAHVVSSAYVKSELSPNFKGFSAGSFQDMTRVAKLNETMWTELFLDNQAHLTEEIDGLVERLSAYSKAIKEGNGETLKALLKEGKEKRLAVDEDKSFE